MFWPPLAPSFAARYSVASRDFELTSAQLICHRSKSTVSIFMLTYERRYETALRVQNVARVQCHAIYFFKPPILHECASRSFWLWNRNKTKEKTFLCARPVILCCLAPRLMVASALELAQAKLRDLRERKKKERRPVMVARPAIIEMREQKMRLQSGGLLIFARLSLLRAK